jgi:hypothetical protein
VGGLMGALPLVFGMFGVPPMLGYAARGMLASAPHRAPLFDGANLLYHAFLIVGGIQLACVMYRSYFPGNGVPVHSRSTGESLLTFGGRINHHIATIFLEPAAVMALGYTLVKCDPTLPISYFGMLALFIQMSALHQYRLYRDDVLDTRDAQLVAGTYARQLRDAPPRTHLVVWLAMALWRALPLRPAPQTNTLSSWAREQHATLGQVVPSRVPAKAEPMGDGPSPNGTAASSAAPPSEGA